MRTPYNVAAVERWIYAVREEMAIYMFQSAEKENCYCYDTNTTCCMRNLFMDKRV